jgi:hypothetical protein
MSGCASNTPSGLLKDAASVRPIVVLGIELGSLADLSEICLCGESELSTVGGNLADNGDWKKIRGIKGLFLEFRGLEVSQHGQ